MSLTPGLNLPFGIQPVNPVPVDSWSGPYTGLTEGAALTLANSFIPSAIRFQTMEARIVVAGVGKKFWYRDGILDGDLVEFASGSGSTGNFLPLSGGTVTGDSYFTQGLSAFTFSAGTINSGSTNLYDIFITGAHTHVQNGLNTYTGGTPSAPSVNISAATLSYVSATTFSAGTINSGSTNLYDIFLQIGNSGITGNFIPMSGTGLSAVTGDIQIDDAVNLSWNATNETLQYNPGSTNIELTTSNGFDLVSGAMMSAGTDLYNIFLTSAPTASTVSLQNGLNTYTGGTPNAPSVNISAATLSYVSATTFSAGTINSGSTNLYDIFLQVGYSASTGNFIPLTGTGANLVTGDIDIDDAVNLSWNATNETLQYNPGSTNIELTTSNGFDLVTGAMMSAGTDLYNIFLTTASTGETGFSGWTSSTGVNSIKLNDSTNLASGNFSLAGGKGNSATTTYATAVGGQNNKSSGLWSFVGAGNSNSASGLGSFIGGGRENSATTSYSTIVGGRQNLASGVRSFIGSGYRNSATTQYATVVGGKQNLASGQFSAVLNGSGNTASGQRSAVIGGINIIGTANDTVYVPFFNIQSATTNNALTNVIVRDANGDIYLRDASTLSGSGSTGNFIPMSGTGLSAVTGDIQIDDAVNLSWNAGNETLQYNPGSTNIELTTSNGFDLVTGAMMSAGTDLYNIFLTTAPSGGTGFSGWTSSTGANSIVANNGTGNLASGNYSIVGGFLNTVSGKYSFIGNGYSGNVISNYAFLGGGTYNSVSGGSSFIGAGRSNKTVGPYSSIVGGFNNKTYGVTSAIGGGTNNTTSGPNSFVGGGYQNYNGNGFSNVIIGGLYNVITGGYSFIGGGGGSNFVSGNWSSIISGILNSATTNNSMVVGGRTNLVSGAYSSVINGSGNTISGTRSAIIGGINITGTSNDTVYVPFLNIQSATTNNALTNIVVRNANGDIYLRDASTLSGSGGTGFSGWTSSTGSNTIIANNGSGNLASGIGSFAGGQSNSALTNYSIVLFGNQNISSGYAGNSIVIGGTLNSSLNQYSAVVNGQNNTASGIASFIGNGGTNIASGDFTLIGNGFQNSGTGLYSTVVNGKFNLASGTYSSVLNGLNNTASGARSAVIGGSGINGVSADTVYVPFLNIKSATTINALTNIVVRNANGDIYLRDASTLISGATSAITASNGLTKSGNNITLGGALTGTTNITGLFNLNLGTGIGTSRLASLNTRASGTTQLLSIIPGVSTASLTLTTGVTTFGLSSASANIVGTTTINETSHISKFQDGGLQFSESQLELSGATLRVYDFNADENHFKVLYNPIAITNNGIDNRFVVSDFFSQKGIVYSGDYSSNFTPESLVTKRYVDMVASGGTSGSTGNFLPISGGTVTGNTIFTTNVSASTLTLTTTNTVAPLNFPVFTSNPGTLNNGDAWILSAATGNAWFSVRINGVTKTVELT